MDFRPEMRAKFGDKGVPCSPASPMKSLHFLSSKVQSPLALTVNTPSSTTTCADFSTTSCFNPRSFVNSITYGGWMAILRCRGVSSPRTNLVSFSTSQHCLSHSPTLHASHPTLPSCLPHPQAPVVRPICTDARRERSVWFLSVDPREHLR